MRTPRTVLILAAAWALAGLAPEAAAQKPGTKFRDFPAMGFKFKPLAEWLDVPTNPDDAARNIVGQLQAERGEYVKTSEDGDRVQWRSQLFVFRINPPVAITDGGKEGGDLRGGVAREQGKEETLRELIQSIAGGLREAEFKEVVPEVEEIKLNKSWIMRREVYTTFIVGNTGVAMDIVYDCWLLPMTGFKVAFVWDYPASVRKDWSKAVEKSMKSIRLSEAMEEVAALTESSSYEEMKQFHEAEVAQTPGWRLVETPRKQYLIKTNEADNKKINEVIKRLEASREVFEEDFPPAQPIEHVSVVRVCATEEEFHQYGDTPPGVAGWFNPRSTELVLFFSNDMGGDAVLEVMTHEGFHQYCHFLFGEMEAHRWFDEGTGDYYGGFDLKGGKLVTDANMSGGLRRIDEIKEMLTNGTYKPISVHIRFDHGSWQSQGPSNVSGYAQSWSIIYFLRQGMRGKVSSKYWKKEYAEILPNYIRELAAGWDAAKEKALKEVAENFEKEKEHMSEEDRKAAEANIARIVEWVLKDDKTRDEVWARAMGESWGKIDEYEFEERWKAYVLDALK